jgi:hypothetical protein
MNKLYNDVRGSYAWNNATRDCSALVTVPKWDKLPNSMMQYITVVSKSLLFVQGCTNPGYHNVQLTQLCMVAPHIFVGPLMKLTLCHPCGA